MKKILLVEDDLDIQNIYGDLLRNKGYQVTGATNGNQGLHIIKTEKPDLVLLDIMLPGGINGFDILEQLKKDEDLKNIPVIILTNLETEKKVANKIGVTDYLIKANVGLNQLVERVNQYLVQ